MNDRHDPSEDDPTLPRDSGGFREDPATQGLKEPPFIEPGEDSGEWSRGGGTDTSETGNPGEEEPRS
jgi:hypothetical protein